MIFRLPQPRTDWPADRWLAVLSAPDGRCLGLVCPSGFAVVAPPGSGDPLARAADALQGASCRWLDLSGVIGNRMPGRRHLRLDQDGVSILIEPPLKRLPHLVIRASLKSEAPTGWIDALREAVSLPVPRERADLLRRAHSLRLNGSWLIAQFSSPPALLIVPVEGLSIPDLEQTSPAPARFPFGNARIRSIAVLRPLEVSQLPSLLLVGEASAGVTSADVIMASGIVFASEMMLREMS